MDKQYIYFYSHSNGPYKSFSQWFPQQFNIPKKIIKKLLNFDIESEFITVKSAEHWMMITKALLFNDTESYKKLMNGETDAKEAKEIGRKVKGFNEEKWDECKLLFVTVGNIYKFSGNLYNILELTNNSILVEASPYDKIWGIGISVSDATSGKKWNGENLLGKALMIAREYLKQDKSGNINLDLLSEVRNKILKEI
jgi:ribA/ribD-fused uncharacterized protein